MVLAPTLAPVLAPAIPPPSLCLFLRDRYFATLTLPRSKPSSRL